MTEEKKRRAQTQTSRDLAGIARLREERDRLRKRLPDPEPEPEEAAPDEEMADIDTGITERIKDDPDLARLYAKAEHSRETAKRDVTKAKREFADMILEVAGEKPPEDRFAQLEKTAKRVKGLITLIAIPAISALLIVGKYLMTKAAADERAVMERERDRERLEESRKEIEDLKARLDRIAHRRDDQPDPPAPKATTP